MPDLISIIVPIYNVEKYIHKCVNSIINQTYKNLEIILVDDGSPDKCGEICDEYAQKDNRIKVIHKKNGGLSDARNVGIDYATGEYIGFVDSDDYIEADMFEKLYHAVVEHNADVGICSFKYVGGKEQHFNQDSPIVRDVISGKDILRKKMTERKPWYWVVAWNKLYKKELFDNIRYPIGKIHEDEFVIHELMWNCNKVACVPDMLYNYVQTSGSIMNRPYNIKRLDRLEALLYRIEFFKQNGWRDNDLYTIALQIINEVYMAYDNVDCTKDPYASVLHQLVERFGHIVRIILKGSISIKQKINLCIFYSNPYYSWQLIKLLRISSKLAGKIKRKTKFILRLMSYVIDNKSVILIDTPTHGNLGDHAIVMTEKQFLKKNNKKAYELTANDINNHEAWYARITPKNTTVLVQGGGFLGSLWKDEEFRFRRILKAFRKQKIIVFPQTVTFDMDLQEGLDFFKESQQIYSSHKNLTIFVREKRSFDFMQKYMPEVKCILVPDIVTMLELDFGEQNRNDILLCFRSDAEKNVSEKENRHMIDMIKSVYPSYGMSNTDTVLNYAVSTAMRQKEVENKLKQFACAKLVITDRLHGMIFSAITNTPCIAFNNVNGKVEGVYEWIKSNTYIRYVDSIDDFRVALTELDIEKKYSYDKSNALNAFLKLEKSIQGE